MIKKSLLVTMLAIALGSLAQDASAQPQYYRIIKGHEGTYQPDSIGMLVAVKSDLKEMCPQPGIATGPATIVGGQVCFVVKAEVPAGFEEGKNIPGTETFYYIQNINLGTLQPKNYVGYIYQEEAEPKKEPSTIVEGPTVRRVGQQVIGVFQANNY